MHLIDPVVTSPAEGERESDLLAGEDLLHYIVLNTEGIVIHSKSREDGETLELEQCRIGRTGKKDDAPGLERQNEIRISIPWSDQAVMIITSPRARLTRLPHHSYHLAPNQPDHRLGFIVVGVPASPSPPNSPLTRSTSASIPASIGVGTFVPVVVVEDDPTGAVEVA